jgi:LPXTG-motif cell wall-anchored protein
MCRGALTRSATLPSPGVPAPRRIAAVAVSTALLLAPAAAHAQNGAGDEQYTDPFANQSQQPAKPKPKPQPAPAQQTTTQQQTTPSTTPQAAPNAAQQPAPQTTTSAGSELPRTGFDVIPLVLVGLALVAAGLLLRRRSRAGAGGCDVAAGGGSRLRARHDGD